MSTTTSAIIANHLESLRSRIAEIRERARKQFEHGAGGAQTATTLSDGFRAFVVEQWLEALSIVSPEVAEKLARRSALVAVGGTGRGELAPYSDIDLMFLYEPSVGDEFKQVTNRCLHNLYDAKLELGRSVRTPSEAIAMALDDSSIATSLLEMQSLWGSADLVAKLKRKFERTVVRRRRRAFFEAAIASARSTAAPRLTG